MVLSSMQSGRAQRPVGVGQEEPVVSVIVTQVGDSEALVVVSQARTLMEELAIDATT